MSTKMFEIECGGTGSSTLVGTRFRGGKDGVMLQLTPSESEPYVQLTREQATLLTLLLLQWSSDPMREPMKEYGGDDD